jgi:4-hydroxy-tetrahydrodipicolinate synthase
MRPFAGTPTQVDLTAYVEAVARETRLPITLYLNLGPSADVSVPDTVALAKLPSVQLIKESSRDLARVSRLIVEIDRARHARYFTTMQMLLATLQLGGSGATMPPPGSRSRGISSMPSWLKIMNAPPRCNCNCSSRCSHRNGCIAVSPPL